MRPDDRGRHPVPRRNHVANSRDGSCSDSRAPDVHVTADPGTGAVTVVWCGDDPAGGAGAAWTADTLARERFRVELDVTEHPDEFGDVAQKVADRSGNPTTGILGAFQMGSPDIDGFYGQDVNGVLGVAPSDEEWGRIDKSSLDEVTNVGVNEDVLRMKSSDGDASEYSRQYWDAIQPVVDEHGTEEIRKGSGAYPAAIELENGD